MVGLGPNLLETRVKGFGRACIYLEQDTRDSGQGREDLAGEMGKRDGISERLISELVGTATATCVPNMPVPVTPNRPIALTSTKCRASDEAHQPRPGPI